MSKRKIVIASIAVVTVIAVIVSAVMLLSTIEYEVSFYSDTGEIIAIETVKWNKSVKPPNNPIVSYGNVFKKWNADISKVNKDLDVHPETESFVGKKNVFALSGAYGAQNDVVYVPFVLCGNVCLSGFDANINYDEKLLELESVFNEDGAIIYNKDTEGVLNINYTSFENTEADVDICSLKFRVKESFESTDVSIEIESICADGNDETFYKPEYNKIDASVYCLPKEGGDLTE